MKLQLLFALGVLASGSSAFILPSAAPAARPIGLRAPAPTAGLFDKLGEIAEYNAKYASSIASKMFDKRQARASHILLKTKGKETEDWLAMLKGKIEAGEITFAEAAQKYSTCPSKAKGGDLGMFGPGAMVPEFDAVVFDETVQIGEIRQAVTKFGTHLVQVQERKAAEEAS